MQGVAGGLPRISNKVIHILKDRLTPINTVLHVSIDYVFSQISDYNPWSVSKQFKIREFTHREDVTVFSDSDRNYTYIYFTIVLEVNVVT